MSTTLHVDRTACTGRGLCHALLPELVDLDPWGYPLLRDRPNDTSVPDPLRDLARTTADACPRLALRVVTGR